METPVFCDRVPVLFRSWTTNQRVRILDWRLGALNWLMKIGCIWFIIGRIAFDNAYYLKEVPTGFPTIWFESGGLSTAQEDLSTPFCTSTTAYNYRYPGNLADYWNELDQKCILAPTGELVKQNAKDGFVVTYMKRLHTVRTTCGESSDACSQTTIPGSRIYVNRKANTSQRGVYRCTCSKQQDNFALGVDELILAVQHQYRASFLGLAGNSQSTEVETDGDTTIETKVETCVLKPNPSKECKSSNGDRGLWEDCCLHIYPPGKTLALTVAQWVAASGGSLDKRAESIVEPDAETGLRPFRRVSGVRLIFNMKYFGTKGEDDTFRCEIEVESMDGWTSLGSSLNYVSFTDYMDTEYYDNYKRGVRFEFVATGMAKEFSGIVLVLTLISGVVILGVAEVLTEIVAFNLMPESELYKSAAINDLQYGKSLARFGVQVALACQSFKMWDKTTEDGQEHRLSVDEFSSVFQPYFQKDTSDEMARLVIEEVMGDDRDSFECENLVQLMSDGLVSVEHMHEFLDKKMGLRKRVSGSVEEDAALKDGCEPPVTGVGRSSLQDGESIELDVPVKERE